MCRPAVPDPYPWEVAVQYWFNVSTGQVETDDTRSRGADVMGPYASQAEAAKALDTARAKTETWDEQDREWDAKGSTPPRGGDEPSA